MGWTYMTPRPTSANAYFAEQLAGRYTILESATVDLTEYYAATRNEQTSAVDCFVAMIRWGRDGSFGYKDMADTMNPAIANAPARVLDALTDLPTCTHEQEYCRHCGRQITRRLDGTWVSQAKPGQRPEVAGPRCYSGYPISATVEGRPPRHAAGGSAPCGTCWARQWRQRCRENIAIREERGALLVDRARVRLLDAEHYDLPSHVKADPTFTVSKKDRKALFAHTGILYHFGRNARWERARKSTL